MKATKRVIVKKIRLEKVPEDEVEAVCVIQHIKPLLTLSNSLDLSRNIAHLSSEYYFGCMFDGEGEQVHTCNLSENDKVNQFINTGISEVNDDHIIKKWNKLVRDNPSLTHVSAFTSSQYQCIDDRHTQFKTPQRIDE